MAKAKNEIQAAYNIEIDAFVIQFKQSIRKVCDWPEVKTMQVAIPVDATTEEFALILGSFAEHLIKNLKEGKLLP